MNSTLDDELVPAQWRTPASMPCICIESEILDQDEPDLEESGQQLSAMDHCSRQLIEH